MKVHYFLLIAGLLCLIGCTSKEPVRFALKNLQQSTGIIELKRRQIKSFELDSITSPLIQCLQSCQIAGKDYLAYLNEETGTLYLNDSNTKKIVRVINVKDGKKQHKKYFQGFYFHNLDSIFLISFHQQVFMINDEGAVLKRFHLGMDPKKPMMDNMVYKGIYSSTSCQGFLANDTLYINSVVMGGNQIPKKNVQVLLNISTGVKRVKSLLFPSVYREHNLGAADFDIYSTCVNLDQKKMIYSFPAAEDLIVKDLASGNVISTAANSRFIKYLNEYDSEKYRTSVSDPAVEYFMTTPSFGGIYYDRYRKLYYRISLLPVAERNVNYDQKNSPLKRLSILVFNLNMAYLGEKLLEPNRFNMYSAFVSRDGFNIQNRMKSDDTLDFTTFEFAVSANRNVRQ